MTDALLVVDLQNALNDDDADKPPSAVHLKRWLNTAYSALEKESSELTVRLVNETEMVELNRTFRGKEGSTNVLSFPFENEFELPSDGSDAIASLLGDVVVCHAVIEREAAEQNKSLNAHYAHMLTHGVLHLCGFDHMDDASAAEMEALEAKILAQSEFENPYT